MKLFIDSKEISDVVMFRYQRGEEQFVYVKTLGTNRRRRELVGRTPDIVAFVTPVLPTVNGDFELRDGSGNKKAIAIQNIASIANGFLITAFFSS